MPKKPVIFPQVGTGFDDVFSTLIHDPKKKKEVDNPIKKINDSGVQSKNEPIKRRSSMSTTQQKLSQAKYWGKLPIGSLEINCVVLDDGRRILPASSVFTAFKRPRRGPREKDPKIEIENGGWIQLPSFIGGNNLIPFIGNELKGWIQLVQYEDKGKVIEGYLAEILPELCGMYLRARRDGKLTKDQEAIAIQSEILYESFAKVGIISLIDEVTGFQRDRTGDALQILLQQYVADGIKAWIKTFPDEFFSQLDKLYSKNKTTPQNRPKYYGRFINQYIYNPIENGYVKKALDKRNIADDGKRKARFHQWLTAFGKDQLLIQLGRVMGVMEGCNRIESFRRKIERMKTLSIAPELFDDLDELEDQNIKG